MCADRMLSIGSKVQLEVNMNRNVESYPVLVGDSFWPLFFTSRLMVRLVGGCTCFCLTDEFNRQQIVLVVPEGQQSSIPSDEELLSSFPSQPRKEQSFLDPGGVPASYAEIRTWQQLQYREIRSTRRTVRVLTHDRALASDKRQGPIKTLMFMRFWRAPQLQLVALRSAIGEQRLWHQSSDKNDSRFLVELAAGESVNVSSTRAHLQFGEIDSIMPVEHQGFTA